MLARGLRIVVNHTTSVTRLSRSFAERTYGNLKDSDRIFTNVYRDGTPYLEGALKRVERAN